MRGLCLGFPARYPEGMDDVCNEYVADGWCFVAVKAKVGTKRGADPFPGQRQTATDMPANSTFAGQVQAMGFRFRTDQLVVPMRLSVYNEGDSRNIVYLLSEGPRKIRDIPEEFVVRQITGRRLVKNISQPLPFRMANRRRNSIPRQLRSYVAERRNPTNYNGAAKELFLADLRAAAEQKLALPREQSEKRLLAISERLELRGVVIDKLHADQLVDAGELLTEQPWRDLARMTLTIVDGDFPRDILARQNLTFAPYRMPNARNRTHRYDPKQPAPPNPFGEKWDDLFGQRRTLPLRLTPLRILSADRKNSGGPRFPEFFANSATTHTD